MAEVILLARALTALVLSVIGYSIIGYQLAAGEGAERWLGLCAGALLVIASHTQSLSMAE